MIFTFEPVSFNSLWNFRNSNSIINQLDQWIEASKWPEFNIAMWFALSLSMLNKAVALAFVIYSKRSVHFPQHSNVLCLSLFWSSEEKKNKAVGQCLKQDKHFNLFFFHFPKFWFLSICSVCWALILYFKLVDFFL